MVTWFGLLSTLKIRILRHSGLDPESPPTFRDDPTLRYIEGILNRVQDDRRSCISRHSGLDPESPQFSQGGYASSVDKGILNRVQDDETRRVLSPDNTLNAPFTTSHQTHYTHHTHHTHSPHPARSDGQRSGTSDHGIVGIGGTRPTLRKAYQNSSFFTFHSSLKKEPHVHPPTTP